jgi:hypothetical protein
MFSSLSSSPSQGLLASSLELVQGISRVSRCLAKLDVQIKALPVANCGKDVEEVIEDEGDIAARETVKSKWTQLAKLAELMIEHSIGVSMVRTLSIKRIDSDYFEEA